MEYLYSLLCVCNFVSSFLRVFFSDINVNLINKKKLIVNKFLYRRIANSIVWMTRLKNVIDPSFNYRTLQNLELFQDFGFWGEFFYFFLG